MKNAGTARASSPVSPALMHYSMTSAVRDVKQWAPRPTVRSWRQLWTPEVHSPIFRCCPLYSSNNLWTIYPTSAQFTY